MWSFEVQLTARRLAKRDRDEEAAGFENALALFRHHRHLLVSLRSAEQRVNCALVNDNVEKFVFVLQVCTVHDLPDELRPRVLIPLFHRVQTQRRNVHVVNVSVAIRVIHFLGQHRVAATHVQHL